MPTFITYASYSQAGIKGIVDKPTDRTEAIKTLVEKAGGKLVTAYMTTGTNDVVLVTELPDGSDAVAVGMAAAGLEDRDGPRLDTWRVQGHRREGGPGRHELCAAGTMT